MFIHGNSNCETLDLDQIDRSSLVYPGKDGVPRVARIRTSHGERIRPFQRLYPLEISAKTEIGVLKSLGKDSLPVKKTPESSTDHVSDSRTDYVPDSPVEMIRSTIRADVDVAIVPQTISRHLTEAIHKSKHTFRALPLTPEHRQLRLQWCQARSMWNVTDWQKVVFSEESRFVLGTDDNRVRVWRRPDSSTASPLFRFAPVEHVWDQLKRQMPSCHSVHDLELAVQDLWTHLPQDNIRCLINSMPDRGVASIAAGGGPTRY
ncbi:transposable element Tcb2 transposase [Trichonephila clavipes]|uniref:Transposable element Tcb2 transposase n=1 Tax=Trichonephila clavipes TaxID=2585209 RepID=A0A8X6SF12_TRICX|nr:transposable element Tcb2 transposase [Trichonephila clavipes]